MPSIKISSYHRDVKENYSAIPFTDKNDIKRAKIKKDVEVEVVSIEKKALADRKLYEEKTVSGMEFLERNSILRAKQQVIEQAIDKARESIAGLNDEEYFNVLEKLLRKNVQQGKGKICFSKKDLDRIPNGFEDRVKEIVAENQGELVIDIMISRDNSDNKEYL